VITKEIIGYQGNEVLNHYLLEVIIVDPKSCIVKEANLSFPL